MICRTAFYLFDSLWNGEPIRLLGIRTGKLSDPDTPVQLSLFDLPKPQTQKQKNLRSWIRSGNVTEKMPFTGDFNKKELLSKQIISLS